MHTIGADEQFMSLTSLSHSENQADMAHSGTVSHLVTSRADPTLVWSAVIPGSKVRILIDDSVAPMHKEISLVFLRLEFSVMRLCSEIHGFKSVVLRQVHIFLRFIHNVISAKNTELVIRSNTCQTPHFEVDVQFPSSSSKVLCALHYIASFP